MDDFLEIDEKKKTINLLNLDDFSIEDLEKYILELEKEIVRTNEEINKKAIQDTSGNLGDILHRSLTNHIEIRSNSFYRAGNKRNRNSSVSGSAIFYRNRKNN